MFIRSEGSRAVLAVRRLVRRTRVLALMIGLLPVVLPAQVTVEELEVHLRLTGAQQPLGQVIPIKNEESRVQQVRITVADWYRDSLGRNVFVEPGTVPESCGGRLSVFPTEFQIAPGATELVRVNYEPSVGDDGCWSIVFVETVQPPPTNPQAQGSFLTIEIRTGVKVYVHAVNPVRAGVIEAADVDLFWRRVDAEAGSRDTVQVREAVVRFRNTGTAHYRVKSTLELRGSDARLLQTGAGPEISMTPGSWVDIHVPIPTGLAPGDYIAIVLLDFGGAEISAAQIDFRIP